MTEPSISLVNVSSAYIGVSHMSLMLGCRGPWMGTTNRRCVDALKKLSA